MLSTITDSFIDPSVNYSILLFSQASDPVTASIEYCCTTAGLSLSLSLGLIILVRVDRVAFILTEHHF
jgi:hypothetical protein